MYNVLLSIVQIIIKEIPAKSATVPRSSHAQKPPPIPPRANSRDATKVSFLVLLGLTSKLPTLYVTHPYHQLFHESSFVGHKSLSRKFVTMRTVVYGSHCYK